MITLSQFSEYYGVFPYYLITNGYNDYVQLPIYLISEDVKVDPNDTSSALPAVNIYDVSKDTLKLSKREQINTLVYEFIEVGKTKLRQLQTVRNYKYWLCLVLSDCQCFFIDDNGFFESNYIPIGGSLNDIKLKLLAANTRHYKTYPPLQKI